MTTIKQIGIIYLKFVHNKTKETNVVKATNVKGGTEEMKKVKEEGTLRNHINCASRNYCGTFDFSRNNPKLHNERQQCTK